MNIIEIVEREGERERERERVIHVIPHLGYLRSWEWVVKIVMNLLAVNVL